MFPIKIVDYSSEALQASRSVKTNFIYILVVSVFACSLLLLPFISVSVSVKSHGIIRPTAELSVVQSFVNGTVSGVHISENVFVNKGDILFTLEAPILAEKERNLVAKIEEINNLIADLRLLTNDQSAKTLHTPLYQQSFVSFKQKLQEAIVHLSKATAELNRNSKLHEQRVIADAEFENFQFQFDKAKGELELLKQTQRMEWQSDLRRYEVELVNLNNELAEQKKEKEQLIIKAPVSGSIQNLKGIYTGSVVFANQELAQISPDTSLIVEAYVNPNDIGLLKENMPVLFQVDAFNYNQWGLVSGKVLSIANDIHVIHEKPVFKIKCTLDKDYLQLKNGHKGLLKKGMTLQARFMVTERTLWQLLYDKVDDWVNPNTYRQSTL